VREVDGERVLVVVNFAAEPLTAVLPPDLQGSARLVLSTAPGRSPGELSEPAEVSLGNLRLAAGEGVALRLAL
jgi:hypothetical protein